MKDFKIDGVGNRKGTGLGRGRSWTTMQTLKMSQTYSGQHLYSLKPKTGNDKKLSINKINCGIVTQEILKKKKRKNSVVNLTTWMTFTYIILIKRYQTPKDNYCMISCI